jgi:hypothetical protein
MTDSGLRLRLQFLVRIVERECRYLLLTDQRLFDGSLNPETVTHLEQAPELAERVDAFVGRLGRLQDTLGDKLLPALLSALAEKPGAMIDNLDKAERLGWLDSTEDWLTLRKLRNLMVHEYMEEPARLWDALEAGHAAVPALVDTAMRMRDEVLRRS